MTALRLIRLGVRRPAAWSLTAAWTRLPVWTGWLPLLSVVVLALCGDRVYSPPIPVKPEAEAVAHGLRLLERLRPSDLADQPLTAYRVSRRRQHHAVDQAHWEMAFLSPAADHLYRLTLTGEGDFRFFAVYRRTATLEPPPPRNEAALRATAEVWRDFLRTEAGIAPEPTVEPPPAVRESPFPGRSRDFIRRWATGHAHWKFVEAVFEGRDLQALRLAEDESPPPAETKGVGGLLFVLALAAALWLPWLVMFVRGVLRGEMGSPTVLVAGGTLAALFFLWSSALFGFTFAAPLTWRLPAVAEADFVGSSDAASRVAQSLLFLTGIGLASLVLWAASLVSLAVTEAYDWKRRRQLLGDVYCITRRGGLSGAQATRLGLGGLALALWVLAIETVAAWLCGRPVLPWHDYASWSKALALGYWPGWKIIGECFIDVWLVTIWLLPPTAFARDRLRERSAALAVGLGVALIGLPFVAGAWATMAGYLFLLGGLLWTLLHYGWPAVLFGCALIGGLFPILWSLRFPHGFEPLFLVGGVAALPLAAFIRRRPGARRTRGEAFDLAPRYVRDRLRLERWREDLDVRWLIHGNLLPPSGFRDEQRRVVAEYAHLPEQGREWFAVLPLTERRVGLAIGEVSGEGLEASLLTAAALAALKSKAARHPGCPVQVVERLNEFLAPRLQSINAHIRLLYGIADMDDGVFTYCNAGYTPPTVLTPEGDGARRPVNPPRTLNPPLHSVSGARFCGDAVRLARGSCLVLMSDWVGELCGLPPDAEALAQRNAALLASFGDLPAMELPAAVVRHGRDHVQRLFGAPLKSPQVEITVVCVEF